MHPLTHSLTHSHTHTHTHAHTHSPTHSLTHSLTHTGRLSKEEIDKAIADAEANKAEDEAAQVRG